MMSSGHDLCHVTNTENVKAPRQITFIIIWELFSKGQILKEFQIIGNFIIFEKNMIFK